MLFKLTDGEPAFFGGIHLRDWTSVHKLEDGETMDDLFAFLTTTPNAAVAAAHPKAMPVILTEPAEWTAWLSAPWAEARALQRALPDGALVRVDVLGGRKSSSEGDQQIRVEDALGDTLQPNLMN